jgi:fructoselysine-6-P-deglycase FrlB-like protein
MADNTTEKAQQTARKATAAAEETVDQGAERVSETLEKIGDTARRASETASRSSEELLTIGRDNMEGVARASQAMLKGASELGSLWASAPARARVPGSENHGKHVASGLPGSSAFCRQIDPFPSDGPFKV